MSQTVIIGGGVIGLSLAYELAQRSRKVLLIERDQLARKSSWAGAGILTPVNMKSALHPIEKLEAISSRLHQQWHHRLLGETGIDNGYRECGGLYLARTIGEKAALIGGMLHWNDREIDIDVLDHQQLKKLAPGLEFESGWRNVFVPCEAQVRPPHHLAALVEACRNLGVQLIEQAGPASLDISKGRVTKVVTAGGEYAGDHYCVAAGPWSESLLKPHAIALPMTPVRGQMILFKLPEPLFHPVINEGSWYLVPRDDGHVLAGATVEEVGFDTSVHSDDVERLQRWAGSLVPALTPATHLRSWAALRPGTFDGFPYLGWIPGLENALVATGHFKSGIHLSCGTAVAMADLIEAKNPEFDLAPLSPARVEKLDTPGHQSTETK